jgi:hypothetical protein
MSEIASERQRARTTANEKQNSKETETLNGGCCVSPCSFSYSWGEMLKFEWRHTPMLKCCLLAAILLPTLAIGIPVTLGHLGYSCRSKESRPPQAESQSQLRSIPNQSLKSSDDVNVLKAP